MKYIKLFEDYHNEEIESMKLDVISILESVSNQFIVDVYSNISEPIDAFYIAVDIVTKGRDLLSWGHRQSFVDYSIIHQYFDIKEYLLQIRDVAKESGWEVTLFRPTDQYNEPLVIGEDGDLFKYFNIQGKQTHIEDIGREVNINITKKLTN